MKKRNLLGKLTAGALALGIVYGCTDPYKIHGKISNEILVKAPGSFGYFYRIELATNNSIKPYVFVGSEVDIRDNSIVFSLDLETVLIPDDIRKKQR